MQYDYYDYYEFYNLRIVIVSFVYNTLTVRNLLLRYIEKKKALSELNLVETDKYLLIIFK